MEYLTIIVKFIACFILYAGIFITTSYLVINLILDVVKTRKQQHQFLYSREVVPKRKITNKANKWNHRYE